MQISDIMTKQVLSVRRDETAEVAAKLLSGHNIGAVPVVDDLDQPVGMLTDRDLVVRCMAAGLSPRDVAVERIMTPGPMVAGEQEDLSAVASRMGMAQVRRVPVGRDGVLTGIVSLADLARQDGTGAAEALTRISKNVSRR